MPLQNMYTMLKVGHNSVILQGHEFRKTSQNQETDQTKILIYADKIIQEIPY